MWHEARKQERLIRGLIVDYRRRAERRKDFYEKIKAEPTQFLQLHGRECKIHLDPAIAAAGEGPAIMMPWQGDSNNMIDRFDARAHLDYISEVKSPDIPPDELPQEERQCNYERYRILAQNVFLGISEDKFLQQLALEEQYGFTIEEKEMQREKNNEKKSTGVAIGYNYNETSGSQPSTSNGPDIKKEELKDSDDESDLDIIDVDLSIDVNKMEPSQAHELNAVGPHFGMAGCDLFSFLTGDADDAEHQKQVLREEKEKAMFSGRKSRRERRAHRDKKLATRVMSPPSYAAPSSIPARSPTPSPTRSPSPDTAENIEFITSFGGDDDEVKLHATSKPLYSEKLKQNLNKVALYSEILRKQKARNSKPSQNVIIGPHRPDSRSRSRSKSYSRSPSCSRIRSRSRSRARSQSRSRARSQSRSRARSQSRLRSRSRSKSQSVSRFRSISRSRSTSYGSFRRSKSRSLSRSRTYKRRSRSPFRRGGNYTKRNKSRSLSYDSNRGGPSKAAVPRYYGRRKEDRSSTELSLDSDSTNSDDQKHKSAVGNKSNTNQNQLRLSGSGSKGPSRETLTLKEKLKRKMQAQLSKQLRADKRAEAERLDRESRRQARRDEEMRQLAIKLRRKQREMRHQRNRKSSGEDSEKSGSRSSSRESTKPEKSKEIKNRSKSPSPPLQKRIPVWEVDREPITLRNKPEFNENYSHNEEIKIRNPVLKEERGGNIDERMSYLYEKYPNREQGSRNDYHYDQWEKDRGGPSEERPKGYNQRGDYRGDRIEGPNKYGRLERPDSYNRFEGPDRNVRFEGSDRYNRLEGPDRHTRLEGPDRYDDRSRDRQSHRDDDYSKGKVKRLVDY